MRRRQQHRADSGVRKHRIQAAGQRQTMFGAKILRALGIGLDGANDSEPFVTQRRLDQTPAPAAEPDDRRLDHRKTFPFGSNKLPSS